MASGEYTGLGLVDLLTRDQVRPRSLVTVLEDRWLVPVFRDLVDQRVLGRQHHVRRAEAGVRTRGVDLDLRARVLAVFVEDREA